MSPGVTPKKNHQAIWRYGHAHECYWNRCVALFPMAFRVPQLELKVCDKELSTFLPFGVLENLNTQDT
jgi:hypothetical protein